MSYISLLCLQDTGVSSTESTRMRNGVGCPFPVPQHCQKEDEQLLVQLLLLQLRTAEVGEHLHDGNTLCLHPKKEKLKALLTNPNCSSKQAMRVSDLLYSAAQAGEGLVLQNVICSADKMAASIESLATLLKSFNADFCESFSECQTVSQQEVCGKPEEAQNDVEAVDGSYIPGLPDSVALKCLAHLPLTHHRLLALLSRRHRELVSDSSFLKLRRQHQIKEQWICIYTSGNNGWAAFDPKQNQWRNLPHADVDPNFVLSDKESLAAGSHLLWFGMEAYEFGCYKYDLMSNGWERGPPMLNPRCLFGSAACGEYAFVAGGFSVKELQFTVLNTAERYDASRGIWEPIPPMSTPRQKCSGFFMDGKFYIIGGKTKDHEQITSGEEYDPVKNAWRTIENMYPPPVLMPVFEPSPPLVAVAGNELYAIENTGNLIKAYEKRTNTWKVLGHVPVRADFRNGWGLAFKALGDTLYVIGGHRDAAQGREGVGVFSWRPLPGAPAPDWQLVDLRVRGIGNFLYNCAVMSC